MKRMMLAGALALGAGGPALAADLPPPTLPPAQAPASYAPAQTQYNWGGLYFGLNGGYGFGNSEWTGGGTSTGSFDTNGGVVGVTAGANYQTGPVVLGVEGDIDWADISGSTTCGGGVLTCQTKNDWLGTVRGRVGYAWDRVLLYATGGGAFGNIKATSGATSADDTEFGWTAGAGLEFALAQNWTARVEYLYVDLSNASFTPGAAGSATVSFDTSLVRAGVDYKFGGF